MTTKRHQVRLDADVAEALGRDAERKGTSLNVASNAWLRRALGLPAIGTQLATSESPIAPAAKATITPASTTAAAGCKHPSNRRIGPYCAACRTTLPAKPGPRP